MELLSPSPPPQPVVNHFAGFESPTTLRQSFGREMSSSATQMPEIEEAPERVHVAVGRSTERSVGLLEWTIRQFEGQEIGIVHVHQPSSTIPTLLGNLPASQANEEMVSGFRREEKEQMKKILLKYLSVCSRAKVKASIFLIETAEVQKGIVELVSRHVIKKLVMGAAPDNCLKVKRSSSKASYTAKTAPSFCEIWFVNKGNHVWTREASEDPSYPLPPFGAPHGTALTEICRSLSSYNFSSEAAFNLDCLRSSSSITGRLCGMTNEAQSRVDEREGTMSVMESSFTNRIDPLDSQSLTGFASTVSGLTSPTEGKFSSESNLEEELELDFLHNSIIEAKMEAEKSTEVASAEILRRERLENEAAEAIKRMKAFEAACARETELRKEVEDELRNTKQEQEKLSGQRDEAIRELQKTLKTLAILDSHVREAARRRDEATDELKLIQASLMTLRQEKKKIRKQREDAVRRLERWRSRGHGRGQNSDRFIEFVDDSPEFSEFSLSDLCTATCNFSESFKIGEGGFGCVYKGEMLDQSVAIKKLHPHTMQIQSEFHQEVNLLSKLQHPHLVTLIGACPEASSLVYEYLPNGSLQDCLFHKTNAPPLTWKTRTCIVAEIASALLFLHSFKPEKIIHSDLKLQNILLDSEFKSKIGDLGISHLVKEETARCPSFRRSTEPKSAFPYMDPEYKRSGELTPKSDIYSFGIIILQLLTGRPPVGLLSEVRRAVSSGKLSSVLDPSAGDWPMFVARRLAELGMQCSEMNSRDRPELTPALVRELERLHVAEERPVPAFFLCPILREIMHDPQVAADGFTYEGEALRGWLENGRETSPMTNLKLSHLNLTPNHALRFAIQDWLCQS
ncbi:U-box domain-containing protein 33-like [Magnolia sinica]|uniref:U-box domain-containing protein 33-like n=1 Tax=Magnolia sinica TaxID=86752 RepID=UPI002658CD30|nr:U-box domain-containing protein 33-like [Magnolia sinica]